MLTRGLVRREGEALFDVVAGFCQSQVLSAIVQLGVLDRLIDGPDTVARLARACAVPPDRMRVLCRAGAAIGVLRLRRDGRFGLTRRGAVLTGVPGLAGMIAHHDVLYRDLANPVAFFRGEVETELAAFWPYVFGVSGDPGVAARYSRLMADSMAPVADDTLAAVDLRGVGTLLDIGGGDGAFLAAACRAHPGLQAVLFDLPTVVPAAERRFAAERLSARLRVCAGSFRTDALPAGADAVSLIRVLYDHSDDTVRDLLRRVHAALPPGGRLIVSEPMAGHAAPQRAGDAYFAIYTLAMRTGRARTSHEIAALLDATGFVRVARPRSRRPFITSVVTAHRGATEKLSR